MLYNTPTDKYLQEDEFYEEEESLVLGKEENPIMIDEFSLLEDIGECGDDNDDDKNNNGGNSGNTSMEPKTPWSVKRKALAIYILIATSAISQTLIEPILPFMVQEQMGVTGSNASFIVGIISSALFFGECISMAPIGYLSDIYGRKWFLVLLQVASLVGVGAFGLIKVWWLAALVRFGQGCAGGIHATSKATLTDISSEHNRSLLLAYIATTYAIARAFASLFGTSFLTLMKNKTSINPYMITCFIASGICACGFIISLLMSETKKKVYQDSKIEKKSSNLCRKILNYLINFFTGLETIYHNKTMFIVTILFCLSYFLNAASITLWSMISKASIAEFGLGFTALQTGIYIGVFGLVCAFLQLMVYKTAMKKIGLHRMFLIASICAAVDMTMFSVAGLPYWINNFTRSNLTTAFVIGTLCGNTLLASASRAVLIPTLNGMIGNLTDLNKQGLVQGSIQTMGNLSKALGPVVAGAVYGLGSSIKFPWLMPLIISLLYILCFFVGVFALNRRIVEQKNPSSEEAIGINYGTNKVSSDIEEKEKTLE